MKLLILLLLILTHNVYAKSQDYHCVVRQYNLDIDMTGDRSTGLFVVDRYNYDTLYVGYAGWVEKKNKVTTFHFYGNSEPIKISFRNEDIENLPKSMPGHIDTVLGGFIFVENFTCKWR